MYVNSAAILGYWIDHIRVIFCDHCHGLSKLPGQRGVTMNNDPARTQDILRTTRQG